MLDRKCVKVLVFATVISLGCSQTVTIYLSKPGAGNAELLEDKEKCQSLQRAVGLDEERIKKCLEAQGWSPVRQEREPAGVDSDGQDERNSEP